MAPGGGRVTAFTAVPREGYDGPVPERRIGDEGPLAAATAALYPNIDHVLVRGTADAVNQNWDQSFYLLERPLLNPCNDRWWTAINAEARRRSINVILTGEMGNMTLSFAGLELLPELLRKGAWGELWRQARALVRKRQMRWRGVAAATFGPWIPAPLWTALLPSRISTRGIKHHTALSPRRTREMDFARLAKARGLDPSYRPRKDAFESRLWVLHRIDKGNFQKAALGGYGIDQRDPTADRRLIEFCLSLPTALFLADGEVRALGARALADRLPPEVLAERRKGYQAADWHEGLTAAAGELEADLARLEDLPAAAMLDLPRMRRLAADLPSEGWEQPEIVEDYRLTLLRGSATGHFIRRATKTNR
jgi:asparagine synthase (glutamine-hydrolysing)